MTKEFIHSLTLIIAIALSFVFGKTDLSQYDLQISALLFMILYLTKRFFIPQSPSSRLIESVVFTLIVLFAVNSTGGVTSPFFFLIYFLLFALSLLLEPVISITTSLALIIFFFLSTPPNQNLSQLLPLFSLAFLTPFALFMGQEHIKNELLKMKNETLQEDAFLFLSLLLKNHMKNIKNAVENFMGEGELHQIKKQTEEMERLIEKYERTTT